LPETVPFELRYQVSEPLGELNRSGFFGGFNF
jgi:hypothetical protein